MRWLCAAIVVGLFLGPARVALAQDAPHPDQLKKMFDDAMDQLKAAQERKNQLAAENDQLKAKLAEMQKKLDASQQQLNDLEHQAAGYAEKTFYLRSHYVAWQEFLRRYPHLLARWKVFLENDQLTMPNDIPAFMDSDWPVSSATTQPSGK